jgi:hypothetical protein
MYSKAMTIVFAGASLSAYRTSMAESHDGHTKMRQHAPEDRKGR